LLVVIALCAMISLGGMRLKAQEAGLNLITSPLPLNLKARPGESVTAELRVKNNNPTTDRLKVELFKFSADNNGEVQLEERGPGDDYFDWVTLTPREFDAEPGEWERVTMTIDLPDDAAFGYYYAVSFSRAGERIDTSKTATLEGQVVTFALLEADVPGAKRELIVDGYGADKSTYEFLPANFSIKVKNPGNVHLVPKGNIFIKRGSKTVSTLTINESSGNVLPNSSRSFTAKWTEGFPVYQVDTEAGNGENGVPKRSLKWDFSKVPDLRVGKYTAKLVLVYDDGRRDIPIEGEVSFWVIPWRLLIALTFVSVFVGVGLWSTGRNIWRKLRKKGKKKDK